MRKKRRERLSWFPPAEVALKRTLIHHIISVLLGSHPPCVSPSACNGESGSLWYLNCSLQLHFTSLSFPSSLANSRMLLIGVWRIIRNLARSELATVPGQRRRMLFLVRLKNRRIFSLCSLCLSCNAHDSGGIFSSFCCSRRMKRLGTSAEFQGWWVWKMILSGCLI